MLRQIIGIILTTFFVAIIYGLFLTTKDFLQPNYDPVASGHRAADNVYGLFGTVNSEIKRNDTATNTEGHARVGYRIAKPYAITADLSAIFGGKIEIGVSSFIHTFGNHTAAKQS